MWTIDVSLVEEWILSLDDNSLAQVYAALEILADRGPSLGRPLVDTVTASRHQNMKELRPGSSGRSEIRILFGHHAGGGRQSWQLAPLVQAEHSSSRWLV